MNRSLAIIFLSVLHSFTALAAPAPDQPKAEHSLTTLANQHTRENTRDREVRAAKAGFAHRIRITQTRSLDPAVFTLIKPFTLDRNPVKLPEDQILE